MYKIFVEQQSQPSRQESEQLTANIVKPQKKKFSSTLNTIQHHPTTLMSPKQPSASAHTPQKTSQPLKLTKDKETKDKRAESKTSLGKQIDTSKPLFYLDKKEMGRLKAEFYVVMEYPSMQVLIGNRHKGTSEIASLTKIMTFYTAFRLAEEHKIDISTHKVVTDEEAGAITGTSAELVCGDELTIEELFYGLMLPSGNDAAIVLAKWGGQLIAPQDETPMAVFIQKMNRNAKILGLSQTSFGNPHGLPHARGVSSPYDQAMLVSQCLTIPLFNKVVATEELRVWVLN